MIVKALNKIIKPFKFQIQRIENSVPTDISTDTFFMDLYNLCKPYTMTSIERMFSLYQSMNYIIKNNLDGDFVECGVWKGGSSMMMAYYLKSKDLTTRKIYLYDTYAGMSAPTEKDKSFMGESASELLEVQSKDNPDSIWCYSSLEDVKTNLLKTGYPSENIVFIKGKVEDTLINYLPDSIALLRLDTDWYESTKVELIKLYPLLIKNGILIIDDFGHWEGAKKAVLEYLDENSLCPLLHRIDVTGRIMIKR